MANCTGRFPAAGRAILAKLLKDTANPPAIYVAWGGLTSSLAGHTWADISDLDTALDHEVERKRGTVTRTDADTYTVNATFGANGNDIFAEIGLFDAAVGGTMLYRGGYSTDSPTGVYDIEEKTIAGGTLSGESGDWVDYDTLDITISVNVKSTNVSVTTTGKTKATDFLCEKPV